MHELSNMFMEQVGDESLECGWHIAVALLHYVAHKCSVDCRKCGFPYISGFDSNQLVCIRDITF